MRRTLVIVITILIISICSGCTMKDSNDIKLHNKGKTQTISIFVASDNKTSITYSDEDFVTESGHFNITNCSKFPIELLLTKQAGEEKSHDGRDLNLKINPKQTASIDDVDKNVPYELGCRVNAKEGTKINLKIDSQ